MWRSLSWAKIKKVVFNKGFGVKKDGENDPVQTQYSFYANWLYNKTNDSIDDFRQLVEQDILKWDTQIVKALLILNLTIKR